MPNNPTRFPEVFLVRMKEGTKAQILQQANKTDSTLTVSEWIRNAISEKLGSQVGGKQ